MYEQSSLFDLFREHEHEDMDKKKHAGSEDEFGFDQELDEAIGEKDVLELRSQLNSIHDKLDQIPHSGSSVLRKKVWTYTAVASVALLIAFGFLFFRNQSMSTEEIFEKYYEPYEVTMIKRSGDTEADKMLSRALQKYQEKDFETAVVLFEEVLKRREEDMGSKLYSGISYLEIREYVDASKSFNEIIEHNDNLYIEQAEWYLGFCYLMKDETEKARGQFAGIAESDSYYKEQAREIIKKMN